MPQKMLCIILSDHGIVGPVKKGSRISGYKLVESVNSENQRNSLIQLRVQTSRKRNASYKTAHLL